MIINIEDYLLDYIGDVSWYGETNHDDKSSVNMDKAREVLYELEQITYHIIGELTEHKNYRKGNTSAEMLHKRAKEICKRFDIYYNEDDWNELEGNDK